MQEVISNKLKRQLQIIQYLFQEGKVKTVDDLIDLVKVHEKTVRADIRYINEAFPLLHIEISSKGHVKLHSLEDTGMEYVYKEIMDTSLEFQVFEHLMNEQNYSIATYTEKFFISESMFRRMIQKWNKAFTTRKLPISIATFPVVALMGDEITIRHLLYRFMFEKYAGDPQSKFLNRVNSIWKLIIEMQDIFGVKISHTTHLKLSFWLFITIARRRKGYDIKKDYTDMQKKTAQQLYTDISKETILVKQFTFENRVDLSVEILLEIMEFHEYHFIFGEKQEQTLVTAEYNESSSAVKAINDFISSVYESIHYQDSSIEQTSLTIYSSLFRQSKLPFFFSNPYEDFKEYIKREHPLFLELFEVQLQHSTLTGYLGENEKLKNKLLYFLIIHSKSLLEKFNSQLSQKRILILTTYFDNYMDWLKNKIIYRFTDNVKVSLYQSNQPQLDIDYINQFDVVVTNYRNFPKNIKTPIIYLSTGVSVSFWQKLKNALCLSNDDNQQIQTESSIYDIVFQNRF